MSKNVTIYDIAQRLNISTGTVNRALNNKPEVSEHTRARVLEAAREMGFHINHAAKSLARNTIYLDFIIHNNVPVFHDEVTRGVRSAFAELADFKISGAVHEFRGSNESVREPILRRVRSLGEAGHQGILMLSMLDSKSHRDEITRFCETGGSLALVNTELLGSGRLFSLRQDAAQAGRLAAELLYWFSPTGKVAVFTGNMQVIDHAESIEGFRAECAKRGMSLTTVLENHDDPLFAAFNTQRLLREHPETDGIYINTANSVSVCNKLIEMGLAGRVRLVASDVFPELISMMQADVVQATIFQDPFYQGRHATKLLYRYIAEGKKPVSEQFISPRVILQSGLSDFTFLNKRMDARAEPEPYENRIRNRFR